MTSIQEELYRKAINNACEWLADPTTVILDTETTSLSGYMVEIAIIDTQGNVLMEGPINPNAPIDPRAAAIHGWTEEKLSEMPTFPQIVDQLLRVIEGKRVVIYNASFDVQILMNELRRWLKGMLHGRIADTDMFQTVEARLNALMNRSTWHCAMLAYSDWCGDWSEYHGNNRWQRLPGGDHSALGDCRATLKVLKKIARAAESEG